jgi:hypothetical protein
LAITLVGAVSVAHVTVGTGLLAESVWARPAAAALALLALPVVPLGTLQGGYTLWVVLREPGAERDVIPGLAFERRLARVRRELRAWVGLAALGGAAAAVAHAHASHRLMIASIAAGLAALALYALRHGELKAQLARQAERAVVVALGSQHSASSVLDVARASGLDVRRTERTLAGLCANGHLSTEAREGGLIYRPL